MDFIFVNLLSDLGMNVQVTETGHSSMEGRKQMGWCCASYVSHTCLQSISDI